MRGAPQPDSGDGHPHGAWKWVLKLAEPEDSASADVPSPRLADRSFAGVEFCVHDRPLRCVERLEPGSSCGTARHRLNLLHDQHPTFLAGGTGVHGFVSRAVRRFVGGCFTPASVVVVRLTKEHPAPSELLAVDADVMTLAVTNGNTADPSPFLVEVDYV